MREGAKVNAMRSGVIVIGALAFGYLSLQLGFKPFLERAQQQQQQQQQQIDESLIQQQRQRQRQVAEEEEEEEEEEASHTLSDYR